MSDTEWFLMHQDRLWWDRAIQDIRDYQRCVAYYRKKTPWDYWPFGWFRVLDDEKIQVAG